MFHLGSLQRHRIRLYFNIAAWGWVSKKFCQNLKSLFTGINKLDICIMEGCFIFQVLKNQHQTIFSQRTEPKYWTLNCAILIVHPRDGPAEH